MGATPMPEQTNEEDLARDRGRWVEHVDGAVTEVFEMMLRRPCALVDGRPQMEPGISAEIVFSGSMEGRCSIRLSSETAYRLTDALIGAEGDWDDEMIEDAVGELCNMIAGGWKSRLGSGSAVCQLSVPAVSRNHGRPEEELAGNRRFYQFNGSVLEVELTIE